MTLEEFRATLCDATAPPGVSPLLVALWHDAKGNWDAAHKVAQDIEDENGAWVHAYLHRKEGDDANAGYWYRHAARRPAVGTLDDEWVEIAAALLSRPD
jgi:hypothetical protein